MTSESVFVAVEGIDASGKTTLTAALAAALRGSGVLVADYAEPSRGPIGMLFRRLSTTGEWPAMTMALLSSADRHAQQGHLRAIRQRCQVLIADRYYLSGLAYHSADGIDVAFYQHLNQQVAKPDAYLYLDVTPALASTRVRRGPDSYWERPEFAARVPAGYQLGLALVADTEGARVFHLDASRPATAVRDAALAAVRVLRSDLREGTSP